MEGLSIVENVKLCVRLPGEAAAGYMQFDETYIHFIHYTVIQISSRTHVYSETHTDVHVVY